MVAKKDFNAPEHLALETIPNLHLIILIHNSTILLIKLKNKQHFRADN